MNWPPYSPDLNPLENVWGILARRVYANGTQYDSLAELKQAIVRCWNSFNQGDLIPCIDSMKSRVADVLVNKGGSINN